VILSLPGKSFFGSWGRISFSGGDLTVNTPIYIFMIQKMNTWMNARFDECLF